MEEWERFPLEKVRLLHTDRFILSVFDDAIEGVIDSQILLLEDSDLRVQNLHELRLLLFQEVDLGVLRELEPIDEA